MLLRIWRFHYSPAWLVSNNLKFTLSTMNTVKPFCLLNCTPHPQAKSQKYLIGLEEVLFIIWERSDYTKKSIRLLALKYPEVVYHREMTSNFLEEDHLIPPVTLGDPSSRVKIEEHEFKLLTVIHAVFFFYIPSQDTFKAEWRWHSISLWESHRNFTTSTLQSCL